MRDYVGPVCLIQGDFDEQKDRAAGICVRYSDAPKGERVTVRFYTKQGKTLGELESIPLDDDVIRALRI